MTMELKLKSTWLLGEMLNSNKKIIVHQGGTRSSKTYSICQFIIINCLQTKNKTYSIVRHSMPALKRSVMKDFFEILTSLKLYNAEFHNKTENIYLLNDNEIQFFSIDDQQKVRGTKRNILWVNEANEIDNEDFRQLLVRTSERIILDYNPDMPENHWIFSEIIDSRDDYELIISTYKDNPFLDSSQVVEIERFSITDSLWWKVFGLGLRSEIQRGTIFSKNHYHEYDVLPQDIKSIVYCDPNLALKSKGDTTSIVCFGYSASFDQYFIVDATLESFSDSNSLLNAVFKMRYPHTTAIGFDGNVTQESTWTNFVRNWSKLHDEPFPRIEYKRYHVDDLAKNIMLAWAEDKILFPPNFSFSTSGKFFLAQLFSFTNKKAGNPDDAPDSLICAFEFIHERRIVCNVDNKIFTKQPFITIESF